MSDRPARRSDLRLSSKGRERRLSPSRSIRGGSVLLTPRARPPRSRLRERRRYVMNARSFRLTAPSSSYVTLVRSNRRGPVVGAPRGRGRSPPPDAGGRRPTLGASREAGAALDPRGARDGRRDRGPTRSHNFSICVELGPERRSTAESAISERRNSQVPYGLRAPRPVSFPERSPLSVPAVSDGKFMWRALNNSDSLRSHRGAAGRTVYQHLPAANHKETFCVSEVDLFGGFPETHSGKNDGTNI